MFDSDVADLLLSPAITVADIMVTTAEQILFHDLIYDVDINLCTGFDRSSKIDILTI